MNTVITEGRVHVTHVSQHYKIYKGGNNFLAEALLAYFSIPVQTERTTSQRKRFISPPDFQKLQEVAATEYHVLGGKIPPVFCDVSFLVGYGYKSGSKYAYLQHLVEKLFLAQQELHNSYLIPSEFGLIRTPKPGTEQIYSLLPGGLVSLITANPDRDSILQAYHQEITSK